MRPGEIDNCGTRDFGKCARRHAKFNGVKDPVKQMDETIKVINQLVADGVIENYAIGGAIGLLFYTEPALTYDLDIFCIFQRSGLLYSLAPVYQYLAGKGYATSGEHVEIEGVAVQFLLPTTALVEEAFSHAVTQLLHEVPTRVFEYEYLLAIMCETGRPKDRARIAVALESAQPDYAKLTDILNRHDLSDKWARIVE